MNSIAITFEGMEDICACEITETIGSETKVEKRVVYFDCDDATRARFCYVTQSSIKVLKLVKSFEFEKLEDIDCEIEIDTSCSVECVRLGSHLFSSQDVKEMLNAKLSKKVAIDHKNPKYIVFVFICDNMAYIGIDYSGFDLSKRDYKLFSYANSLNASIAYALDRICEIGDQDSVVDPMCKNGLTIIEAAHFLQKRSVNFYRKDKFAFLKFLDIDLSSFDNEVKHSAKLLGTSPLLRDVTAAKKNAKVAEVECHFTKVDVSWLDIKLDKVNKIVSFFPSPSKSLSEKRVEKIYKEFFERIDSVWDGTMVIAFMQPELFEKLSPYKVVSKRSLWQNKQELQVLTITR